jgi:ribosomal protein S27AE
MKCPHCHIEYHDKPNQYNLYADTDGIWVLLKRECPSCGRMNLELVHGRQRSSTDFTII